MVDRKNLNYMRKITKIFTIACICFAVLSFMRINICYSQNEEEIELILYYPAPYGTYDTMQADMLAIGRNVDMLNSNAVASFEKITEPATGADGDLYYDTTHKEFRYYSGNSWNRVRRELYAYKNHDSDIKTTSTVFVWDNNLKCSIDVAKDDILVVQLHGEFRRHFYDGVSWEPIDYTIAHIDLLSGSATRLGDISYIKIASRIKESGSKTATQLYRANKSGALVFAMKWHMTSNRPAHAQEYAIARNRTITAYVLGRS
jgi:hypothetical protein